MDNLEIGKRIKQAREEKNMSLQEVAELTGVARSTVQRYEAGKIDKIKLPVIESIARALGFLPEWIIGKTDKKYPTLEEIPEIITYYNKLNFIGKETATEQVRLLTLDEKYTQPDNTSSIINKPTADYLTLKAAHERTDIEVTDEMRQTDDDIMNNDNLWK